jgi:hypothetical protein
LCSVYAGSYKYPVYLNYNTSGIQVSQISSCVGLGWDLTAEAKISRIVRGIPDDQNDNEGKGWLYIDSYAIRDFPLNGTESLRATWLWGVLGGEPELDCEPDLYYFSIPGMSGSFILGNGGENIHDREVLFLPYQNIKVTYSLDYNGHIDKFTITDGLGNVYQFFIPVIVHTHTTTLDSYPHYFTYWYSYVILKENRFAKIYACIS